MEIIGPNMSIREEDAQLPFFYLLGPSKGAEPWQGKICEELKKYIKGRFLVYYRQPTEGPALTPAALYKGKEETKHIPQVRLEMRLQMHAGIGCPHGCIISWLPIEKVGSPRADGQQYGCDTSRVLGEWFTRIERKLEIHFAWGGDSHYPGLDEMYQVTHELYGDKMELPHYGNLENIVLHAVHVSVGRSSTVRIRELLRLTSY